jgi:hypothetical protein
MLHFLWSIEYQPKIESQWKKELTIEVELNIEKDNLGFITIVYRVKK